MCLVSIPMGLLPGYGVGAALTPVVIAQSGLGATERFQSPGYRFRHGAFKEVTEEQIQNISAHANVKAVGKRTSIGYLDSGVFVKSPAEVSFMDDNCTEWSFAEPTTGHKPQGRNV